MFDALLQYEDLLANPAFVAFVVTLIVDILGYIENKARNTSIGFSKGMLLETFAKYEASIILLSTYLPIEQAVVGGFIIDVITRVFKKLRPAP